MHFLQRSQTSQLLFFQTLLALILLDSLRPAFLLDVDSFFLLLRRFGGLSQLAQRCAEDVVRLEVAGVDLDRFAKRFNGRLGMV